MLAILGEENVTFRSDTTSHNIASLKAMAQPSFTHVLMSFIATTTTIIHAPEVRPTNDKIFFVGLWQSKSVTETKNDRADPVQRSVHNRFKQSIK